MSIALYLNCYNIVFKLKILKYNKNVNNRFGLLYSEYNLNKNESPEIVIVKLWAMMRI